MNGSGENGEWGKINNECFDERVNANHIKGFDVLTEGNKGNKEYIENQR